jgi:hypothetical protein
MVFPKRSLAAFFAAAVALAIAGTAAAGGAQKNLEVSLELVGHVNNPGGSLATSIQYGYVAYLHGRPIFNPGPVENETTARLTFYSDTTTLRTTNNGPLRILSREGVVTFYNDPSANGSFANPDSFRDGTPILVARLRHQVVINTLTGAFTASFLNTITATRPFAVGSREVQLGKVGQQFRILLSGQANAAPPPAAHIAGYTVQVDAVPKLKSKSNRRR